MIDPVIASRARAASRVRSAAAIRVGEILEGLVERALRDVVDPLLLDLRQDLADRHGRRHPAGGHPAFHELDDLFDLPRIRRQAGQEVVVILRGAQWREARQFGNIDMHTTHLGDGHPFVRRQNPPREFRWKRRRRSAPRLAGTGRRTGHPDRSGVRGRSRGCA